MSRRQDEADAFLSARDPVLAALVRSHGPCGLADARRGDPFQALVSSIVAQMISSRAARTVYGRLLEVLKEDVPTPGRVARVRLETLRRAGLSRTKAAALRDLARRVESGALPLADLARRDDDEVTRALCAVQGVGPWTAQMFLIFHLSRPDVFPHRDLGVLEGIRRAYALPVRPAPADALARAAVWRPHRTAAAWYMWRVLEGPAGLA